MALPPIVKTWQHDVNQTIYNADPETCTDELLLAIKNSLIGFVTNAWTVWGSCDGAGGFGNDDAVDRWTDASDLVHQAEGTAHSWMVLENSETGVQMCFNFTNWLPYSLEVVVSPGGEFGAPGSGGTGADGTGTNRPTAGDEIQMTTEFGRNGAYTYKLHVQHTTDAECTRFWFCSETDVYGMWGFETPYDPITGWTDGVFWGSAGSAIAVGFDYSRWNDNSSSCRTVIDDDVVNLYMSSEGIASAMIGEYLTAADDDTGEWPLCPVGLVATEGAHRGRKGSLYDIWWGSTGVDSGSTFPDDATRLYAQFDHMIVPWDGTTPQIS